MLQRYESSGYDDYPSSKNYSDSPDGSKTSRTRFQHHIQQQKQHLVDEKSIEAGPTFHKSMEIFRYFDGLFTSDEKWVLIFSVFLLLFLKGSNWERKWYGKWLRPSLHFSPTEILHSNIFQRSTNEPHGIQRGTKKHGFKESSEIVSPWVKWYYKLHSDRTIKCNNIQGLSLIHKSLTNPIQSLFVNVTNFIFNKCVKVVFNNCQIGLCLKINRMPHWKLAQ